MSITVRSHCFSQTSTPSTHPEFTLDIALRQTDEKLATDVRNALRWEPGLGRSSIAVAAKNGSVSMHGSVETLMNKFAAVDTARRVRGVLSVDARLTVLLPTSKRSSDENILEAANATLGWDICLAPYRVTVEVDHGWISIFGEVKRQYQKEAAEQDVSRLNGVLGVFNRVTVIPTGHTAGIADSIMRALNRNWSFDPRMVRIATDGGVVTLIGSVTSPHQKELAKAAAWAAPGVVSVRDELTIAPSGVIAASSSDTVDS